MQKTSLTLLIWITSLPMMVGCKPDVQPVNAQNDVVLLGGGTTGGVTPPPAITDPNGGTTDTGNIDSNGDTTTGDTTGGDDGSTLCLLYTSPSPRDRTRSRMPSSA